MSTEPCPLIIAIDGPAGAGKSTVAARLASRFGLLNLETGAMYRAFALKALEQHIEPTNGAALEQLAASTNIRLEPTPSGNRVLLDDIDVTARIRQPDVTQAASQVSVHPAIRRWMVDLQRELGAGGGIVMEGRDIGTVVFPHADIKVFLDASPEARSERRYAQAGGAGSQEAILREIRERDERDRTRAQSPLKPAPDAVVIDSTNLTLDQVVARIESLVTARLDAHHGHASHVDASSAPREG
jgi:cytidylate kinase